MPSPMSPSFASTRREAGAELALMLALFFLSGAAGLIYQVVWARMLTLVIGVSIFAISAVVCSFMAGLGLGSYLIGRWTQRWRDPLLAYGVIEALIGLYAAMTPWLFEATQPAYVWAFSHLGPSGLNVFRIALSMLLLLVPTFLMGGTLPLLARVIERARMHAATGTGILYAVNTAGAVSGCFLAGFVLLAAVGVRNSLYVAAALNLAIAAAVIAWRRRRHAVEYPAAPVAASGTWHPDQRFILGVFFLAGLTALGYEVLWTRALLVHLKSSTYAFSLMLSVYLLGVALGSAAASRLAGTLAEPMRGIVVCQVGVAATTVVGLLAFPHLRMIGLATVGGEAIGGFPSAVAAMLVEASVVLLPPTFFMGAMFPFGVAAYHQRHRSIGDSVGSLYASNTAGNIAGAILIGFAAIPLLGVRHSLVALAALNLLIAARVWARIGLHPLRAAAIPVALVAAVAIHVGISHRLFLDSINPFPAKNKVLSYREGASDTVAVVERTDTGSRGLIYSDGRGAAGTNTLPVNLYFGHLPMLLHPAPRQVLHICYGSGNSVLALARHAPERIDVVELSPHVREASSYFWTNEGVLDNPNVHLIIEDGRNYLLGTDRTYDVISLEPPNIFTAGVVNLYTREFYDLARQRLNSDGIVVQWIPTIQVTRDDRAHLMRAFTDAFPVVSVWQQLSTTSILLVGSTRRLTVDVAHVQARLSPPMIQKDLAAMGLENAYGVLSFLLLDDDDVRSMVADHAPVTDDRTIVDFSIPKFSGSGFGFSIFTYPIGGPNKSPAEIRVERNAEYRSWRGSAASFVSDPCEAKRVDRAIALRQRQRPGDAAAAEQIASCPAPLR